VLFAHVQQRDENELSRQRNCAPSPLAGEGRGGGQPRQRSPSGLSSAKRIDMTERGYLTRRPLKNPALVVFCFMLAVSPCSAGF
jgi:hypothetical protein